MAQKPNRREFTRVSVHIESEVTLNNTTTVTGRVRNVSMNGLFLECPAIFSAGTPCLIVVHLSYDHLQNLVRYNAGRALEQVEEELQTHAGIKQYPETSPSRYWSDEREAYTS